MPPRKKPPPAPEPPRRRRGTGSIARLADGTLRARLPADASGYRPARDFPPDQWAAADAWIMAEIAAKLAPPPSTAPDPLTVLRWVTTWLDVYVEPIRTPTTVRRYRHSLGLLAPLDDVLLAELTRLALQALIGELAKRLGASTVKDAVGVWRRCFDAAVDDGYLVRNPARQLVPPQPAPKGTGRHVTADEAAALWPAIRGHRFEACYALLLGTGIRIGEVLGLHWEHVDFERGRAWIQYQWTDHTMRDRPKGRRPRWIRLPPRVLDALRRHRGAHPTDVLVMQSPHPGRKHKGRLPSKAPRPWSVERIRFDLTDLAASLDLDPFTPHATRRGLSSALLDGKVSPATVAERLGHASAATTLRHYAAASAEAQEAADAVVEAYLGVETDDLVSDLVSDG